MKARTQANPPTPPRWAVTDGRTIAFDGEPVFYIDGHRDVRGNRYQPAALDTLTRTIASLLNDANVDGSEVAR